MAEKSDWLKKEKAKIEIQKTFNEKEEVFDTLIYGIKDVSSKTLHITSHKEVHERTLENLKTLFPDKHFEPSCMPLSYELDLEKIDQNLRDLIGG